MQEGGMSPCTLPLPVLIFVCNVCSHSDMDMSVVLANIASGLLGEWLVFKIWKEHVDNGVAGFLDGLGSVASGT